MNKWEELLMWAAGLGLAASVAYGVLALTMAHVSRGAL